MNKILASLLFLSVVHYICMIAPEPIDLERVPQEHRDAAQKRNEIREQADKLQEQQNQREDRAKKTVKDYNNADKKISSTQGEIDTLKNTPLDRNTTVDELRGQVKERTNKINDAKKEQSEAKYNFINEYNDTVEEYNKVHPGDKMDRMTSDQLDLLIKNGTSLESLTNQLTSMHQKIKATTTTQALDALTKNLSKADIDALQQADYDSKYDKDGTTKQVIKKGEEAAQRIRDRKNSEQTQREENEKREKNSQASEQTQGATNVRMEVNEKSILREVLDSILAMFGKGDLGDARNHLDANKTETASNLMKLSKDQRITLVNEALDRARLSNNDRNAYIKTINEALPISEQMKIISNGKAIFQ